MKPQMTYIQQAVDTRMITALVKYLKSTEYPADSPRHGGIYIRSAVALEWTSLATEEWLSPRRIFVFWETELYKRSVSIFCQ